MSGPDPVTTADPIRHLVSALTTEPGQLKGEVLQRGIAALRGYLYRRFGQALSGADIDEIAGDAVAQLVESVHRGMVSPAASPAGYLLAIASNQARTAIRRIHRNVPVGDTHPALLGLTDDQTAARLEASATADLVQAAMADAYHRGDATAVRVATYLLDHIQRTGASASSRTAAEALGLSHEGVGKALRRLRAYIAAYQQQAP
ncbi:sigma factor [Actinoplanes oblitus]|uniref:Sigma factor n=1 Tax=Actinoplanes oblitus TaxID=3040509 RepID=A0ABY8WNB3_9ACTN|nr:sigma factor [Actinoplanes oblitus]WIM98598.1 sigma factor [Actinoplanes oblitus]